MRAEDLDDQFPIVTADSEAIDAARLIAEHGLPGVIVTDASHKPVAVLLASEMLHFVLPRYVRQDPALAGVVGDTLSDHSQNLVGKTVADLLPEKPRKIPTIDARDSVVKVAAEMSQQRSPLIAVTKKGTLHGALTAAQVMAAALKS
ncbi:CBS domain-containing protein [Mycobacterium sp.]|uniref:CBS domain-containing protein n=1 Tax=Mycobacterium sp. TaxID=1785 RepID=UPI0031E0169B